ncbi:MAG: HEAT repeat domain-containing protein [Candidatus Tectomicrobia bacterium]|nr:HEAT repeat domain-containing protein [Candidatus Tectomicrobia bacterium]
MKEEVVTKLLSVLRWENELTRCCAARALGKIKAREAIPSLVERLLQDPDPDMRMEAAAALGMIASSEGTEALIDSLHNDPDRDVRIEACIALTKIGDTQALDSLIGALAEDEPAGIGDWRAEGDMEFSASWEIQKKALEALREIGDERAVNAVIHLLENDDYEDLQELGFRLLAKRSGAQARNFLLRQLKEGNRLARRRAAKALEQVKEPDVVQALIKTLLDKDSDVRISAARALAEKGDSSVVVPLILLLKDPSAEVRREASTVVAKLRGEEVVEQLLLLLDDEQKSVQQQAVRLLGDRGESQALGKLLALLEKSRDDELFCNEIVKALGKIIRRGDGQLSGGSRIRASEAIDPLCKLLRDRQRDPETRFQAALSLGYIVKDVGLNEERITKQLDPVDILIELVDDADERVCFGALLSLTRIGGPRASDTLIKALRGEIPERAADHLLQNRQRVVRRYAARVIREREDPDVVEALMQVAEDVDPELQREVIISLGRTGDPRAIAVVLKGLTSWNQEVRMAAIDALEMLKVKEAVDPIIEVVKGEGNPFVVQRAIEVLGKFGDRRATEPLVRRLSDNDKQVRRVALETLAALGDKSVVGKVRPLIFEQGGDLRREAVSTLKKLGDPDVVHLLLQTLNNQGDEENHWIAVEALAEIYKAT